MRVLRGLELIGNTTEERLPDYAADFPCISSRAELYHYPDELVPWHWHPTAELFYVLEGELEYHLPDRTCRFRQGSGGLLLPNILHRTTWARHSKVVQLLHLFEPKLLFGGYDTRMAQKYLLPLLSDSGASMLSLSPDGPGQAALLAELRATFALNEDDFGYELALRNALSQLWVSFASMPREDTADPKYAKAAEAVKRMLVYIQENLAEPIDAEMVAEAAHISPRTCYRLFRQTLRMAPNEYIQSCRIRQASVMLIQQRELGVTEIALRCGFANGSYFGRVFRKTTGMTPVEFRKWQSGLNEGRE